MARLAVDHNVDARIVAGLSRREPGHDVVRGEPMSGVIAISAQCAVGRAIDDLLLLLECTPDDAWAGRVFYVPL